jgi:hypothetical protein
MMQGATDFHHHVATPGCPYPDGLFAHAAAFDTAGDLFTAHPSPSQFPMTRLLGARQGLPAWLLHRLHDVHALQRQGLKAPILPQATADRQRIRGRVSEALIMDASRMSLTQEQEAERRLDQENVFPHVPLVLAAITRFLFSRILGAWDGALGAVMTTRGTVWTASAGAEAISRGGPSSIPRRSRQASIRRQGASPKVRRVLRHTGSNT